MLIRPLAFGKFFSLILSSPLGAGKYHWMASESFSVTAKPQQHLRSLLLKHFPGSSSDLLQNTRRLAHFNSWFMEPALLPSKSGELSWNELFPWGQPGNFQGRSTPSETACRNGEGGGICSLLEKNFCLWCMQSLFLWDILFWAI